MVHLSLLALAAIPPGTLMMLKVAGGILLILALFAVSLWLTRFLFKGMREEMQA